MNLNFKKHTVILTCGPSGIGKSYMLKMLMSSLDAFNEKKIQADANASTVDYQYLSSDQFRYQLLNENTATLDKLDKRMSFVSKQAFSMLENALVNLMSYPVNRDLIFVDSTALNKEWREKIILLCKEHQYNVDLLLFDFKNRKDMFKYSTNKLITEKGVTRFYEQVLPDLEKHSYNNIIRIDHHLEAGEINVDTMMHEASYNEVNRIKQTSLKIENSSQVYIVGDVHGCYYTLKQLLQHIYGESSIVDSNSSIVPVQNHQAKVILAGDFIDKGKYSYKVLALIKNNLNYIIPVLGNHENFVVKYLENPQLCANTPQHIIDTYFTSVKQYEGDDSYKALLNEVVGYALPFVETKHFIVTHAPTKTKYLGKLDSVSLRNQRNWVAPRGNDKMEWQKELDFLQQEASFYAPLHFFGHVCTQEAFKVKNKISLDTGAVHGGGLTYYQLTPNGAHSIKKDSIATHADDLTETNTKDKEARIFTLFNERIISHHTVEGAVKNRISWLCKQKVNYISSTMAPASHEVQDTSIDIESLNSGLDYYKGKGVSQVMLQPKYMGSRCNVYLLPRTSDCYMTSRNGYVIRKLYKEKGSIENFRAFFNRIKADTLIQDLYKKYPNLHSIVLDGELLPWFSLGKGLVEEIYDPLHAVILNELTLLQKESFPQSLNQKMLERLTYNRTPVDERVTLTSRAQETYKALDTLEKENSLIQDKATLQQLKDSCKKFEAQVNLFGRTGNIHFKPFAILKLIMADGSEVLPDYTSSFNDVSHDHSCIISLDNIEDYNKAREYFNISTNQGLEGVVIKPILPSTSWIETKRIAPYLKVRNAEYLRLVYGYDYLEQPLKYRKLSLSKNTNKKIQVSINEFLIGQKLLQVPYNQIDNTNDFYKDLLATMIIEEQQEKTLDPRL